MKKEKMQNVDEKIDGQNTASPSSPSSLSDANQESPVKESSAQKTASQESSDLQENSKQTPASKTLTREEKKARRKQILSALSKKYLITSFSGMAIGLFCTLIAGTILQTLSDVFKGWANPVASFLFTLGYFAKIMMGAGIGAGIAFDLKANKLTLASAAAAGFIGAFAGSIYGISSTVAAPTLIFGAAGSPGNPINSFLCALAAVELGRLVSGKTKIDILVVPLCCLIGAGLVAFVLGRPVDFVIKKISEGIAAAMNAQPFFMSIIVSVSMGLFLTLPTSSAAIGISAGLNGFAAGAAVAGCCAHMVGFAVMSFRENKWSGLISQGLGTSMLQIPNVTKKPILLLPPIIASAITGPLAVLLFKLQSDAAGSGMGTAGLVGVIQTVKVSASSGMNIALMIAGIIICLFVLPALISLGVTEFMRKRGWIKFGDLKIN